ncbi:MAG TPA: hypothetical protein VE973_00285 [Candidatus Limnocylindria bacterium]|nr:hypothetical protein [Candidatus Limnocylindria bacterium]
MKNKIGIIGVGFVGGALEHYFKNRKIKPLIYDKYKNLGSPAEVNKADVIFICTPTPFVKGKGFELSAVEAAIKILKSPKVVIIKSSVVPGTTEALQKKYPKHKIMFNPEFLREVSANYDMANPDRQVLGVTKQSKPYAKAVLAMLPNAPYEKIMASREAEAVKYMANSFLALKVIFANEFSEICKSLGINYSQVKEAVVKDVRIGDSHFDVSHGGYRGYGGSCFPKDVNAIIQLAENRKIETTLLKTMRGINRKLLKASGINEDYFLTNAHKKTGSNKKK